MSMNIPHIFEFGPFRLDVRQRELLRNGVPVPLRHKAFDLLLVLVENRNSVVEKKELMRLVWPDSEVEENNLTVQKRALVAVLGDGYIQTVPRHGYRFIAEVREITAGGEMTSRVPIAVQQSFAGEKSVDEVSHSSKRVPVLRPEEPDENHIAKSLRTWNRPIFVGIIVLLVFMVAALIWQRMANRTEMSSQTRVQVRSPSDEAEVMRVVKESQIYETLGIYTHPEAFDRSQLSKFWMLIEEGGKAVPAIEAAVERLRTKGWRYADESRVEIFDFRYVRIFSPKDYSEVGTSERWYVPTVWANSGVRVENRNVYLGVYDIDYTLRKINGRWLIEENSTPRPTSIGNQNK
jgi:DNA-binding winged helix-turn-helix (wHTH) protein